MTGRPTVGRPTVGRPLVPRLSVGVLSADWSRLREEVAILAETSCWAHVDVMDGSFCPALTVGAPLVRALSSCGAAVDAHLMVDEPLRFLPEFVGAGAVVVTVHAESTRHLHRTLHALSDLAEGRAAEGHPILCGVALNPGTPVAAVEPVLHLVDLVLVLAVSPGWSAQSPAAPTRRRIAHVRALALEAGRDIVVEVDGGVTFDNAAEVASWGADTIVSGSAIYDGRQPAENLRRMLGILDASSKASREAGASRERQAAT